MPGINFGTCCPMTQNFSTYEHVGIRPKTCLIFLAGYLLLMAGISPSQATGQGSEVDLSSDLRTVIILAAYPCKSIVGISQKAPRSYEVSCSGGRQYLIHVDEQEMLQVGEKAMSDGTALPDGLDHVDFMKRQFFSIINLAGHNCDNILSYETAENNGHIVTCMGQLIYRIHVTPVGQVAVDMHRPGK